MRQPIGALNCFTVEVCEYEDLSDLSNDDLDALVEILKDKAKKVIDKVENLIVSSTNLDLMARIEVLENEKAETEQSDKALEIMKNKELANVESLESMNKPRL
ncbi:hypothetical protein QYF36_022394 [Acer negundo]|nr:hypothetical protein QYF36_022394 [Acer negundo]